MADSPLLKKYKNIELPEIREIATGPITSEVSLKRSRSVMEFENEDDEDQLGIFENKFSSYKQKPKKKKIYRNTI